MNLELGKVIGLLNYSVYSYLKDESDEQGIVTVDLDGMSNLFKMRLTSVEDSITNLAFLGFLFKHENTK